VHKRGITTLQAQERLAAALGLPGSPVTFPALKDRDARSVQYGTLRCDGPEAVEGKGFRRKRHGE
jgi:tRNA(Glu) U13 pseudouridine synthase TruD